MKKIFFVLFVVISFTLISYVAIINYTTNFNNLSSQEKHERIVAERTYAIEEARLAGNYHCCIDPPCTMCYMEANEWNNNTPGTCACDDLIAEGKEACPQCQRGLDLIHSEENTFCDIDDVVPTCNSVIN